MKHNTPATNRTKSAENKTKTPRAKRKPQNNVKTKHPRRTKLRTQNKTLTRQITFFNPYATAHLNEVLAGLVYLSYHEGLGAIPVVALVKDSNVYVDDHALF